MRRTEAGFSLIIAIMVIMVLTLLAAQVLTSSNLDSDIAGNARSAESALYIAEAGISWGMNVLRDAPFELPLPGRDIGIALTDGLGTNTTRIDTSNPSADCPDSSCPVWGWRRLNNTNTVSFGGGTFRVVVSDDTIPYGLADSDHSGECTVITDPTSCTGPANKRILLRSLGIDALGARRMIEVSISNE